MNWLMILVFLLPGQLFALCRRLFLVRRSDLSINDQYFPPWHANAIQNFELTYLAGFGCGLNLKTTMFVPHRGRWHNCTCRNISRNRAFKPLAVAKL